MKQRLCAASVFFFILLFSGCTRYFEWGEDVINQGEKLDTYTEHVRPYIRSTRVYDYFTTLGIFDALWLSKPVITSYAQAHAAKHGFTREQYKNFLKNQQDEQRQFITFYLLSVVGGAGSSLLTDKNASWSVQMQIGTRYYAPVKLELVDELPPEYQYFFGKHWTVFKDIYIIRFNAFDVNDNPLLRPGLDSLALVFHRMGHEVGLEWEFDGNAHLISTGNMDADVIAYDIATNI